MAHPYTRLFAGKTIAPTVNDDVSLGYEVGDVWVNETADTSYVCLDATDGAALWLQMSAPHTPIAYKTYAGGDISTTSTSMVDADATNLAVTFTVPASGKVLVRLTAQTCPDTGASNQGAQHQWGLREGGGDIAGPHSVSRDQVGNGFLTVVQASKAFVRTGLTPSASLTYKWAHKVTAGTGRIGASAANGEAIMEVWALP